MSDRGGVVVEEKRSSVAPASRDPKRKGTGQEKGGRRDRSNAVHEGNAFERGNREVGRGF